MSKRCALIFDEIDGLSKYFFEQCVSYLSAERRKKVFSYYFLADRKSSAAAYLLLRLCLKKYGIDESVVFAYDENQKPYLRDYRHVHFNLSHSRNAVACAVSDVPVGADAQEVVPIDDGLARMALTAREYAEYKDSSCPDELFCKIWTIKESFLKKTGQGVTLDLTGIAAESFGEKTFFKGKNYCCCVTGASELQHVDMYNFNAAIRTLRKT